jgi:hypothetical protein
MVDIGPEPGETTGESKGANGLRDLRRPTQPQFVAQTLPVFLEMGKRV